MNAFVNEKEEENQEDGLNSGVAFMGACEPGG